jgi:predicted dithiol-disulfide oxidoreductase (DUF899 family)
VRLLPRAGVHELTPLKRHFRRRCRETVRSGFGVSTFAREGGTVYHCCSSYARGTEFLMGYYAILDRAPKGRDEGDQPMSWLRRHDEYDNQ